MKTPSFLLATAFVASIGGASYADVFVLPNGTMLVTDGPGSKKVSKKNNLLFCADGNITTEDECKTGESPVPHFHGTLGGKGDGGKACGHGKVKLLPNSGNTAALATLLEDVSTSVNIVVSGKWGSACAPNGDTAIAALENAIAQFPAILEVIDANVKDKKTREKLKGKAIGLKSKLSGAKLALQIGGETTADEAKSLISKASDKIKGKVKKFFKDLQKGGAF